MTKKKMIETIQKHEAALGLKLKHYEQMTGEDSPLSKMYRSQWCSIYELMRLLDIKADNSLPDNIEAMRIVEEIRRDKQIVEQFEQEDFDKRDQGL